MLAGSDSFYLAMSIRLKNELMHHPTHHMKHGFFVYKFIIPHIFLVVLIQPVSLAGRSQCLNHKFRCKFNVGAQEAWHRESCRRTLLPNITV